MTELAWIRRKSTAFQTGSLRRTAHDAKVLLDQSGIFLMTYTKCTYSPPTQHEDKIVDGTVVTFFYHLLDLGDAAWRRGTGMWYDFEASIINTANSN